MNSALITTESSKDLELLLELAKKSNFTIKLLSKKDEEEFGLINAIKDGRTEEYIDTDIFLNKIAK